MIMRAAMITAASASDSTKIVDSSLPSLFRCM